MENEKNIFVCSNLCNKFLRDVVTLVRRHFKNNKKVLDKIRFYSKDEGNREDFKDVLR